MRYFLGLILSLFILASCTSDTSENDGKTPAVPVNNQPVTPTTPAPVNTEIKSNITSSTESPDIQVTVKNMPSGPVYMLGTYMGANFRVDSLHVDASGKFRFQRKAPLDPGMYYFVFQNNTNIQILLDQDQTMKITTDASNFVMNNQVEGNIDTELLTENGRYEINYRSKISPISNQLKSTPEGSAQYKQLKAQQDALIAERKADLAAIFNKHPKSLFTSFKIAGKNPDIVDVRLPDGSVDNRTQVYLYRTMFWDDVNFNDSRLLYTPVITNKLKKYISDLTPQQPDSIINATSFLINKVLDKPEYFKYFANQITLMYQPTESTLMDAEKVHVFMIQNYFTKERAFWSDAANIQGLQQRAYEMAGSLTGNKGPDVVSTDPNGKQKSIYELKSDYIIVYLYNPTCEHCMEETPKLVQLYNQMSRKEMDVFAIAIDTNDAEWKGYIQKNNMTWTNVHDPTNKSIYAKYYVNITPEIYVLNKARTIIAKNLNVSQIEEVIRRDQSK